MFEIFMILGMVVLGVLLLYIWSDVRELKQEVKSYRRDLMRNSVGGRTSENYEGFSEEDYWREAREEQAKEQEGQRELQEDDIGTVLMEPASEERRKTFSLKPGEEQVLREILMEFLN